MTTPLGFHLYIILEPVRAALVVECHSAQLKKERKKERREVGVDDVYREYR